MKKNKLKSINKKRRKRRGPSRLAGRRKQKVSSGEGGKGTKSPLRRERGGGEKGDFFKKKEGVS